jgi:hypothetical protein
VRQNPEEQNIRKVGQLDITSTKARTHLNSPDLSVILVQSGGMEWKTSLFPWENDNL